MTDYGQPVTFGLSLIPSVELLDETRQLARAADAAGLEYLAIQDHAYNIEFLDVWTLISYLAAETDRISFFPDVASRSLGCSDQAHLDNDFSAMRRSGLMASAAKLWRSSVDIPLPMRSSAGLRSLPVRILSLGPIDRNYSRPPSEAWEGAIA